MATAASFCSMPEAASASLITLRAWLGRFGQRRNKRPGFSATAILSGIADGNYSMARVSQQRDSLLGTKADPVQPRPRRDRGRSLRTRVTVLQERVAIQHIVASVCLGGVGERCVLRSLHSRRVCANVRIARFLAAIPMGGVRRRPGLRSCTGPLLCALDV